MAESLLVAPLDTGRRGGCFDARCERGFAGSTLAIFRRNSCRLDMGLGEADALFRSLSLRNLTKVHRNSQPNTYNHWKNGSVKCWLWWKIAGCNPTWKFSAQLELSDITQVAVLPTAWGCYAWLDFHSYINVDKSSLSFKLPSQIPARSRWTGFSMSKIPQPKTHIDTENKIVIEHIFPNIPNILGIPHLPPSASLFHTILWLQ